MKNRFLITGILLASVLAAVGCADSKKEDAQIVSDAQAEEPAEEVQENEEEIEEEESVPGKMMVVEPLPVTLDANQLTDCTAAVSIGEGHAYVDGAGEQKMKVTVFTYDLYDMVDISQLKSGDTITIRQEPVIVASLERKDRAVIINGGIDVGGYELRTDEDTTYYEISYSDMLSYYEIGEATLPVSADFVYTDSSDLDNGPVTYTFSDLAEGNVDFFFTPYNTKIVIEGGTVVAMERTYTP